jgi:hypothetical protein
MRSSILIGIPLSRPVFRESLQCSSTVANRAMHSLNIGRAQFPEYKLSFPNLGAPGVRHTTGTQGALKIRFIAI